MSLRLAVLQCLLACYAGLFLSVNFAIAAQQPAPDAPKTEAPKAGVNSASMPKCQYCPDPEYSQEARSKKYEGVVVLNVVVTSEGKATNIQVVRTLGMGLDEKAIDAVRRWRFKPATKDGKPVNVQVPIEITFRCCP